MNQPQQPGAPAFPQQPQPGYQVPQPGYQAPQPGYQAPQHGYQAPQPGYQAPQQSAPRSGISLANVPAGNNGGRYLPRGEFDYVVDVGIVKTVKGQKGMIFIVEFTIVESSNPTVRAGTQYSWVKNIESAADPYGYHRRDVKGWICEVVSAKMPGADPWSQWEDGLIPWIAANGDDPSHAQPARGMRMHVHTWEKAKGRTPEEKARSIAQGDTVTICDWGVMGSGEVMGLQSQVGPVPPQVHPHAPQVPQAPPQVHQPTPAPQAVPQAPPAPQVYQPTPAPQAAPQAPQVPQPAPHAQQPSVPQVPTAPPPGWPAGMSWPGAQQ